MTTCIVKDLWWPFGSHLIHYKYSVIYAEKNQFSYFYKYNYNHVFPDGVIHYYFENISTCIESDIVHSTMYLPEVKYLLSYKPDQYDTIDEYHSDVLKRIYKPTQLVKYHLQNTSILSELPNQYIGLHIRLSDKVEGPAAETDRIGIDEYLKACIRVRHIHHINDIIVCSDTVDAIKQLDNLNKINFHGFRITWNTEETRCKDNWEDSVVYRTRIGKLTRQDLEMEYLTCFVNMEILINCTVLVGNYDSCFALVAAEIRNNHHDVNIGKSPPIFGNKQGSWST